MTLFVSEPEMLVRFVDGLKVAAGSAHQLAHAQENTNWLKVRDMLEALIESGQKMAMSKSMPRAEVLRNLDIRAKNLH
jgi:hypothetical protein